MAGEVGRRRGRFWGSTVFQTAFYRPVGPSRAPQGKEESFPSLLLLERIESCSVINTADHRKSHLNENFQRLNKNERVYSPKVETTPMFSGG